MAGSKVKESLSMVGQGISSSPSSSSSSWPTSASTSAHLSQEYNSLLATGYPTAHPSQASFQGEQSKYLAAGLATEAKYGLMSDAKYGMVGDPVGLETKYSTHLASQSQGNQVQCLKA